MDQVQRAGELLVPSNFIRAVREAGYLSISTALAEMVDNSLQAEATAVAITVERPASDALTRPSRVPLDATRLWKRSRSSPVARESAVSRRACVSGRGT
jgi:hypothetical protein